MCLSEAASHQRAFETHASPGQFSGVLLTQPWSIFDFSATFSSRALIFLLCTWSTVDWQPFFTLEKWLWYQLLRLILNNTKLIENWGRDRRNCRDGVLQFTAKCLLMVASFAAKEAIFGAETNKSKSAPTS